MEGAVRRALGDVRSFSRGVVGLPLREYQLAPLRAVIAAVMARAGSSYVIEFARQSGKDEAVAQMLAFLLLYYKNVGGKVVLAAPSAGQAAISKQRLRERLQNPFSGGLWRPQGVQPGSGTGERGIPNYGGERECARTYCQPSIDWQ